MSQLELFRKHPHLASFHVRQRLITSLPLSYDRLDWEQAIPLSADRLKNGWLASDLLAIDGVCSIYIDPYKITVLKANAYAWHEIEAKVEEVLQKHNLD